MIIGGGTHRYVEFQWWSRVISVQDGSNGGLRI